MNGNSNGNGKIDPALITAQQATELALRPLRDAEKRAATTRLRLNEAESVLTLAQQEHDTAQMRWVEDDSAANKKMLHQTREDVEAAKSRVEGFKRKLAAEEAALTPLQTAHNDSLIVLAEAQAVANLAHLEDEWSAARDAVNVLEAQLITARNLCAEAEHRYKTLAMARREADNRRAQLAGAEHFRKYNPSTHGFERTRIGF